MIAIVGAGLTGLALAHELAGLGVEHVVLEAADRPGGVIRSAAVQGRVLEWGPQRARLTTDLARLVDDLGLRDRLLTAPSGLPLLVYVEGRLRKVPFTAGEFLRTDLLSLAGKLRLLAEPLTGAPRDEERVADLFTRKVGREAYEKLLGPLYGGLYASDPADMEVGLSLRHVLKEFAAPRSLLLPLLRRGGSISPPSAISFVDGLQTLTDALHARNPERVRLRAPVRGMRPADGGYVLEVEGEAGDDEVRADRVVITTPAAVTADLLRGVDAETADRIGSLRYNPLAVVHILAEPRLRALGFQVALGESLLTRGVTFNHALFARDRLYTAYLGGARAPEVVGWDDERIASAAARELRLVAGVDVEVISVAREAMPAWDLSWRALEGLRMPEGVRIASNWMARPGMPGRLAQARRLARELAGAA